MAVLAAMLLGSINYNNNHGFLLTFLLGSMAFVSILHTWRNLLGLKIISVFEKGVFAGEETTFRLTMRIPRHGGEIVSFKFPKGPMVVRNLAKDQNMLVLLPAKTEKRGLFRPGPLEISTRYPLGLFRAWAKLYLDISSPVYPKPISSTLTTSADMHSHVNGSKAAATEGCDDFHGLNVYQPGDSLQHLAWKAFARGQGLLTKIFAGQSGASLLLDWQALQEPDPERKLSRLCGMVLKAHRLGLAYGLKLPGIRIESHKTDAHLHRCLKALALFHPPS